MSSNFSGKFSGWSAGLGYTSSTERPISFYGYALYTQIEGDVGVKFTPKASNSYILGPSSLSGMENSGYSLATGVSLRPWTPKSFPVSFGFLAGPFASRFHSQFTMPYSSNASPGTVGVSNYEATSFVFGLSAGVQAYVEISKFKLNPYALFYFDFSDPCQDYETENVYDTGSPSDSCSNNGTRRAATLKGTFRAFGLNLSAFGVSLNAYTQISRAADLSDISLSNYALSYTFDL